MKNEVKKGITIFLLFLSFYVLGQNSNVVPAENFPRAKPALYSVQNLKIKAGPMVTYLKDVVYVNRDGLDLHLHLQVLSATSKEPLPCIVYVQGSAWMKQDVYVQFPQLAKFAARGYVIASVEYRHSGIAPFPAQVQDTKTAIRFMRKNAERFNIDPENIFVWGDSSGGHTAVFVGITSGNKNLDTDEYSGFSDKVNAIIDYYGPSDIVKMNFAPSTMNHSNPKSPEGLLIGGLEVLKNTEKAQKANPINYISREKSIPSGVDCPWRHGSSSAIKPKRFAGQ